MKTEDLDQKFDDGEEVLEYFDLSTLKRPGIETQKITLELPQWINFQTYINAVKSKLNNSF